MRPLIHAGSNITMRVRRDAVVRRLALVALVALVALAGCGGPPELPRLPAGATILAFGDSLTHGTGAQPEASYPAVLERRLGRRVVRSGVPGELSGEGRARLPGVLERVAPDLVILCHGGNDILRGDDLDATRDNLAAMVRAARQRDIPVVLVGVPERGLSLDTAGLYYAVAEEAGIPLEDEALAAILADPALKSDRVHPNGAGYRELARAVHALLAAAGVVAAPTDA